MASDIPKKSYGYHKTATAKAVGRGAQQAHVAQEFGRISQYWDELQQCYEVEMQPMGKRLSPKKRNKIHSCNCEYLIMK